MSGFRILACLILPPLGVLDRGIKAIIVTCILTVLGWVPGQVAALIYASRPVTD